MRRLSKSLSSYGTRGFSRTAWVLGFTACCVGHATEAAPAAQQSWQPIAPGIELFVGSYRHRPPINSAKIWGIRINPLRYRMRIIDVSRVLTRQTRQSSYLIPSLRTVASEIAPAAALNGSYVSSYAFPVPITFVRIDGKTTHPMTRDRLMSGLLCVSRTGKVDILEVNAQTVSAKVEEACSDALQSGPRIVEAGGKNGIVASEAATRAFDRSAVCTTSSGSAILVHAERTTLFDLGEFLRRQESEGGFGCNAALNMSGDTDSGLLWRNKGQTVSAGAIDASLATAIAVVAR